MTCYLLGPAVCVTVTNTKEQKNKVRFQSTNCQGVEPFIDPLGIKCLIVCVTAILDLFFHMFCTSLRESLCPFNVGDSFLFVVQIMYIVFPCDIFALSVRGLISCKHGSNIKRSDSRNWVILECPAFTRQNNCELRLTAFEVQGQVKECNCCLHSSHYSSMTNVYCTRTPRLWDRSLISWGVSAMTSFYAHCIHNA